MGRRVGIPDDGTDWNDLLSRVSTLERVNQALAAPPAEYSPAWTSSGTAPVIGNGALGGLWTRVGGLVWFSISLIPGSSTTFGTGFYDLSLPVAARAGLRTVVGGVLTDVGVQSYEVSATIGGGSAFEEILASSNTFGPGNWSTTSPFTFGNGDRMTITGTYVPA